MSRFKLIIAEGLSVEGLKRLENSSNKIEVELFLGIAKEVLEERIENAHGLLVRSSTVVDAELIEAAPQLKLIARAGNGLDHIDCPVAKQNGIEVLHTPNANADSAAEHCIGLLIGAARNYTAYQKNLYNREWRGTTARGIELSGKTLGIIGLGRIGQRVATRMQAFGMKLVACDPYLDQKIAQSMGIPLVSQDELLSNSDFISLHTPLTEETRSLISDEAFLKMKKGCVLINAARGPIVHEPALLRALSDNRLGALGLDVFEDEPLCRRHPLFRDPRCFCTPHIGARTEEACQRVDLEVAEKIVKFVETQDIEKLKVSQL